MFVLSKSVAVIGHLWLHLRFFGICVYFVLQQGWLLTATLFETSGFFYMCFFLHVYSHFLNFFFLEQWWSLTASFIEIQFFFRMYFFLHVYF